MLYKTLTFCVVLHLPEWLTDKIMWAVAKIRYGIDIHELERIAQLTRLEEKNNKK